MPEQSVIAVVDLGLSLTPFLLVGTLLAVGFSWLILATRVVARLSPAENGLVAVYTELPRISAESALGSWAMKVKRILVSPTDYTWLQ
jgi:hypothetical protein